MALLLQTFSGNTIFSRTALMETRGDEISKDTYARNGRNSDYLAYLQSIFLRYLRPLLDHFQTENQSHYCLYLAEQGMLLELAFTNL